MSTSLFFLFKKKERESPKKEKNVESSFFSLLTIIKAEKKRENNCFLCTLVSVFFFWNVHYTPNRFAPTNTLSYIAILFFSLFIQSIITLRLTMVRRIEGTIDYEKHNEVLNDNHKVLIYLDDMTLTGK